MQDPRAVAKQPVRDDLEQVHRRRAGAASSRAARSASSARTSAPCAGTRVSFGRRRLLERLRARLVHRAPAVLHHQVRQRQVVAEARIDLDVVGASHRVDRAVAARDRAERRLGARGRPSRSASRALPCSSRPPRGSAAGRRRRRRPDRRTRARASRSASGAQRRVRVREGDDLARRSDARRGPVRRPCRRARFVITRTPGNCSAISSVRSLEASEVTTICSRSAG